MKHRPAQYAAVEPLVRAVYDGLYGPQRWALTSAPVRQSIVRFAIDQARTVTSGRVLVHTPADGDPIYIPATDVLTALEKEIPHD